MTSYIFKNMLIVERSSTHMKTVEYLKNQHKQWFPERQPFEYYNRNDKIIAFYSVNIENEFNQLLLSEFIPSGKIMGMIKMLCDNNNIRIIDAEFNNDIECKIFLSNLREYLITTISGTITDRYILHWAPTVLQSKKWLEKCANEARLLSDTINKTHTFDGTGADVIHCTPSSNFLNIQNNSSSTITPDIRNSQIYQDHTKTIYGGIGQQSQQFNIFGTGQNTTIQQQTPFFTTGQNITNQIQSGLNQQQQTPFFNTGLVTTNSQIYSGLNQQIPFFYTGLVNNSSHNQIQSGFNQQTPFFNTGVFSNQNQLTQTGLNQQQSPFTSFK